MKIKCVPLMVILFFMMKGKRNEGVLFSDLSKYLATP